MLFSSCTAIIKLGIQYTVYDILESSCRCSKNNFPVTVPFFRETHREVWRLCVGRGLLKGLIGERDVGGRGKANNARRYTLPPSRMALDTCPRAQHGDREVPVLVDGVTLSFCPDPWDLAGCTSCSPKFDLLPYVCGLWGICKGALGNLKISITCPVSADISFNCQTRGVGRYGLIWMAQQCIEKFSFRGRVSLSCLCTWFSGTFDSHFAFLLFDLVYI